MSAFAFVGKVPASKSMLNRALLLQSYQPGIEIHGDSQAEDVKLMRKALEELRTGGHVLEVGAAGSVLRFLALRASREKGQYVLRGTKRLFARPQEELVKILFQLGVKANLFADRLEIQSEGWKLQGDTLLVPSTRSSQFATSVLLNSWNLPFDLFVAQGGRKISEGYWRMSVRMANAQGMRIDFWDSDFRVPKGQQPTAEPVLAESDMSSAFVVAALAAVSGHATILDFPSPSLQPDTVFVSVLASMGVPLRLTGSTLKVEKAPKLNGVAVNLNSTPDLFPVLASLCALAEGSSHLYGAPHLVYKESDRLNSLAAWIRKLGREVEVKDDGLMIRGELKHAGGETLVLDSDQDHRLAFAAAVWKAAGLPIEIINPESVNKSFPEFWQILGWEP